MATATPADDIETDTSLLTAQSATTRQPQSFNHRYPQDSATNLFDIIIVYANEDYDEVCQCKRWMEEILSGDNVTGVKIELYDSEVFMQSYISNVGDVIDRGMLVLLYLTSNFCNDRRLDFFSSEGVFKTRIEEYPTDTVLEKKRDEVRRWCLRPIHTVAETKEKPRRSVYITPSGIGQMYSIDYFSKYENHVHDRVKRWAEKAKDDRERISELMVQEGQGQQG